MDGATLSTFYPLEREENLHWMYLDSPLTPLLSYLRVWPASPLTGRGSDSPDQSVHRPAAYSSCQGIMRTIAILAWRIVFMLDTKNWIVLWISSILRPVNCYAILSHNLQGPVQSWYPISLHCKTLGKLSLLADDDLDEDLDNVTAMVMCDDISRNMNGSKSCITAWRDCKYIVCKCCAGHFWEADGDDNGTMITLDPLPISVYVCVQVYSVRWSTVLYRTHRCLHLWRAVWPSPPVEPQVK